MKIHIGKKFVLPIDFWAKIILFLGFIFLIIGTSKHVAFVLASNCLNLKP